MSDKQKQDQFVSLVMESKDVIWSIIHKNCQDKSYVNDLWQDIMTEGWRAYDNYKGYGSFRNWICTIARRIAYDRLTRLKSGIVHLVDDNVFYSITDEVYEEKSIPVLDSLSSIERETLDMVLEGMSYKQIGNILDEPANRIGVRMHRIKERLSKQINNTV